MLFATHQMLGMPGADKKLNKEMNCSVHNIYKIYSNYHILQDRLTIYSIEHFANSPGQTVLNQDSPEKITHAILMCCLLQIYIIQ